MTTNLEILNQELISVNEEEGTEEYALDIQFYGKIVRFIIIKDHMGADLMKNVIVNKGTKKEDKLSFTHTVTNSDYLDVKRYVQQNLA